MLASALRSNLELARDRVLVAVSPHGIPLLENWQQVIFLQCAGRRVAPPSLRFFEERIGDRRLPPPIKLAQTTAPAAIIQRACVSHARHRRERYYDHSDRTN